MWLAYPETSRVGLKFRAWASLSPCSRRGLHASVLPVLLGGSWEQLRRAELKANVHCAVQSPFGGEYVGLLEVGCRLCCETSLGCVCAWGMLKCVDLILYVWSLGMEGSRCHVL